MPGTGTYLISARRDSCGHIPLLAVEILIILKVTSVLWLVLATAAWWVPISLFLNVYSARFKPPTLKKRKDRTRKTVFEWLYERDRIRAPKMSDSDRKDS